MPGNFAPVRRGLLKMGADKALVDALETWVKVNSVGPAELVPIPTDTLMGRDTAGTGNVENISIGGGLEFSGAGAIRLTDTGVVAGSYTNLDATIDAKGRITAASSGAGSSVYVPLIDGAGNIVLTADGKIIPKLWGTSADV